MGQVKACFVATATMGEDHPDVEVLRAFRDRVMLPMRAGRAVIRFYRIVGPTLARWISASRSLRVVAHVLIVKPAAWIAGRTVTK
jgi:hypothetical protein